MARDTLVLGAGIVGVSVAWHLARRGRNVTLVDRKPPGQETSYGNAGIIQREAVSPYPFPHDLKTLLRVLPNRSIDIRYQSRGIAHATGPLFQYWLNSFPGRYARIVPEYASLIMRSTDAHAAMIQAAGVEDLVRREGWLELYRSEAELQKRIAKAEDAAARFGVVYRELDRDTLDSIQPHLSPAIIGGMQWQNSWTVFSPGELVQAYARAFEAEGGHLLQADIRGITTTNAGWQVTTDQGTHTAKEVVVALGPWAGDHLTPLGYRLPLFVKRGYHMHYSHDDNHPLQHWIMDAEIGYLLEPMQAGIRLTTGAELADRDATARHAQLDAAERAARDFFPLGQRVESTPWKGSRPCTPDMKPIIGPAPRHRGLWFAFGHGHQGFTLGPITGELLGQMMEGETTAIDMQPFRADRFSGA